MDTTSTTSQTLLPWELAHIEHRGGNQYYVELRDGRSDIVDMDGVDMCDDEEYNALGDDAPDYLFSPQHFIVAGEDCDTAVALHVLHCR